MKYPLIGITTYERDAKNMFVSPGYYVDAVRRAGGIPVLVPAGEALVEDLLTRLDGLILSGGGDLDAELYSGSQHPTLEEPNPERDQMEIAFIRQVVQGATPTLCICRGAQVLNVALGGSLIEHLPDEVGMETLHRTATPGASGEPEAIAHPIQIQPGSQLAALLGQTEVCPLSWHHQAVREVAPGLLVSAYAPDGTIEALEKPDHPWLLAVQWHPELTAATDPLQQRLFDGLIGAALNRSC